MSIPVFKPSIKRRDMHAVLSCLITDVIGSATLAEELVNTVAGEHRFQGGLVLREYTRAIEITMESLGLTEGNRVLISPLAPNAYGKALKSQGLIPVFADVKEEDACLEPESVHKVNIKDVQAFFIHAPLGRVPDMEAFYDIDLPIVVDIGEALGAREANGPLGSGAQFILLPMEPEGIATTGGGTIILAKDKADLKKLHSKTEALGRDAFLSDINASLGIIQYREYPQALEIRETVLESYEQSLQKGRHRTLSLPRREEYRTVAYSFPVVADSGANDIRSYSRKKGVETLLAFSNSLLEEYPEAGETCPKAQSLALSTLLFPLYPTLGKKNVQLIMNILATLP